MLISRGKSFAQLFSEEMNISVGRLAIEKETDLWNPQLNRVFSAVQLPKRCAEEQLFTQLLVQLVIACNIHKNMRDASTRDLPIIRLNIADIFARKHAIVGH